MVLEGFSLGNPGGQKVTGIAPTLEMGESSRQVGPNGSNTDEMSEMLGESSWLVGPNGSDTSEMSKGRLVTDIIKALQIEYIVLQFDPSIQIIFHYLL